MIYEQLERLLTEQGFSKVPSNLPEFSFFFRNENTYVNVLHIIEYKQGLYITEEQYAHIKETIRGFFRTKEAKDVHILSLLICPDMEKAKQLCGSDPLCWLIDPVWKRLLIYENQAADFYGMKSVLENFLSEMAAHEGNEQETFAGSDGNRYDKNRNKVKELIRSSGLNITIVIFNVILFIICTFTGELLYNIGAFSVMDLVENGEWHRIFTSMFLHADIEHLISNMLVLYYIGNVIEKQIGHVPYVLLYFLCGITGNIFSAGYELLSGQYIGSVGASGAIFGVEGALLMLALVHKEKIADVTTGRIVLSIAFSLYSGFTSYFVNNAAHIGGLLTGFVLAGIYWLLLPDRRKG